MSRTGSRPAHLLREECDVDAREEFTVGVRGAFDDVEDIGVHAGLRRASPGTHNSGLAGLPSHAFGDPWRIRHPESLTGCSLFPRARRSRGHHSRRAKGISWRRSSGRQIPVLALGMAPPKVPTFSAGGLAGDAGRAG